MTSSDTPQSGPGATSSGGSPREAAAGRARQNAVFLIPGLLGFESFASFGYFTDRVSAALRAGLERELNEPVPIIPVPIPPTASLEERQRRLVKTLSNRVFELTVDGVLPHIHLLGHSTGGVDANLLTSDRPIGGGGWADVAAEAPQILAAIRSVVTLASPHQGACITRDPIAEFIRSHGLRSKAEAAALLIKVTRGALADPDARDLVTGAVSDPVGVWRFLRDTLTRGQLIDDLQPTRGRGPGTFRTDVLRKSIVAIANYATPGLASVGRPNSLFRDLSVRASGKVTGCSEEGDLIAASLVRLSEARSGSGRVPIIGNAGAALPPCIDAGHNDGIVNTARQLFDPSDPHELSAIVIGDHFDVVGHYDRRVWRLDRDGNEEAVLINAGLLHSGSAFRDAEFFALYRLVADCLASAVPAKSLAGGADARRERSAHAA